MRYIYIYTLNKIHTYLINICVVYLLYLLDFIVHNNTQKSQAFKLFHSTAASMSLHILGLSNYLEYKNQMFNCLLKYIL